MDINQGNLAILTQSLSARFNAGLDRAKPTYPVIAMEVPSTTAESVYPYLRQFGTIRKWVGDRVVQNMGQGSFRIVNDDFEQTNQIDRNAILDDSYGLYGNLFEQIGLNVGGFADKLMYSQLKTGFSTLGPDGQYFFDTDHPVGSPGREASVSNFLGGSGEAWYIVDSSQVFKPLIFQNRQAFNLQSFFSLSDPDVFWKKSYVWGVDGRAGAGFSPFWQLMFANKNNLDATNVNATLTAMRSQKNDAGEGLDINPTHIVVSPALETAARALFDKATLANGETNSLNGRLQIVVSSRLLA